MFAGVAVGFWALDSGAGPIGAIGVGGAIGAATFGMFQLAFGLARNASLRLLVAIAFAAPAAYAGYHIVFSLAQYGVPSDAWRHVFAAVGATVIGFTAVARLTDAVRWIPQSSSVQEPTRANVRE